MEARSLREWLEQGPFTLTLSAGFFGFFAHAGVLAALDDAGLAPARVTGASAGALAGGAWAAGVPGAELGRILESIERSDFWDMGRGWGLLRGELFRRRLEGVLPVRRFEDCRAQLAVSVFDLRRGTRVVDRGPLAPAIHASCALPGMFHPVRVGEATLLDGGIADRHGLAGTAPDERVLLHLLTSRSPWRRPNSPSLRAPRREGLYPLLLDGLPRVGPFRLGEGRRAFALARDQVALRLA